MVNVPFCHITPPSVAANPPFVQRGWVWPEQGRVGGCEGWESVVHERAGLHRVRFERVALEQYNNECRHIGDGEGIWISGLVRGPSRAAYDVSRAPSVLVHPYVSEICRTTPGAEEDMREPSHMGCHLALAHVVVIFHKFFHWAATIRAVEDFFPLDLDSSTNHPVRGDLVLILPHPCKLFR